MRLVGNFYTLDNRPEEITLRVRASNLPAGAEVALTDLQLQSGPDATGIVPNPREVGTVQDSAQYRNGVVNGEMTIIAMSNSLASQPARVEVQGVHDTVQAGDMRFGQVDGSAWVDGRTHDNSQGWGRAPIITKRQDLRMDMKVGEVEDDMGEPLPGNRAHLRLAWFDRHEEELSNGEE